MSSQAQIEIGFWRDLFRGKGTPENFLAQRQEDWQDFATHLPELAEFLAKSGDETTLLDVGTGLISPLEFADGETTITAVDPLMDAYNDFISLEGRRVRYLKQSGEGMDFPDASFDAVSCINVIDHTPNPDNMIAEIARVLKPGGKFFFQVNFDQALSPAHYGLWNKECVDALLKDWTCEVSRTDERQDYGQTRYWAVYTKA